MMSKFIIAIFLTTFMHLSYGQSFFFGNDMSYVNEMEDCGVVYHENDEPKEAYSILSDHGGNLVRLRLWHTPSWYDNLNEGQRYSDLDDVKLAISKAKQNNLQVLLDFHLSDNWADPSKQLVPNAWLDIVDNTSILKDSLYNYIFKTLSELHQEDLSPEMIQIGNETNKGILLSPEDNATWTLHWARNAILFNNAIKAVEDFENSSGKDIKIVLHVAGPANAEWLIDGFISNGVTNFDVIGLSYYWAWHMPTTIAGTGQVIKTLRNLYPDKDVMIVETGYIWTTESNDNANNIISETHPNYHPASPTNQRDWLIDLTQEVIDSDGKGVIYWEPFWVSSPCYTQWGQGSHQEHATFFDFNNNLLEPGGIEWMSHNYGLTPTIRVASDENKIQILSNSFSGHIKIKQHLISPKEVKYSVIDTTGNVIFKGSFNEHEKTFQLLDLPFGMYVIYAELDQKYVKIKKFLYSNK